MTLFASYGMLTLNHEPTARTKPPAAFPLKINGLVFEKS
jgi:hypothetical protein